MREIVLDTETTGLDARNGDRLIEIGCVEIFNRVPTGREFHTFICPETKSVHADAERVHGLSNAFLKDKPLFPAVVELFLDFIGTSPLVIHNASFDIGFINMELERIGAQMIGMERVVDTLQLARRRHPAGPNSLDALCKRYGIDNTKRIKHGAIVDSLLLAQVYVELIGERQATLVLATEGTSANNGDQRGAIRRKALLRPVPLPSRIGPVQIEAHVAFVATLGDAAIWNRYVQ